VSETASPFGADEATAPPGAVASASVDDVRAKSALGLPWIAAGFAGAMLAAAAIHPAAALAALPSIGPWFACGALAVRAVVLRRRGADPTLMFRGRTLLGPRAALFVPAGLFLAACVLRETSYLRLDLRSISHLTSSRSRVEDERVAFAVPAGMKLDLTRFALADGFERRFRFALPPGVSATGRIAGDAPAAFMPLRKPLDFTYQGELLLRGPRRAFRAPKNLAKPASGAAYAPAGPPEEIVERRVSFSGDRTGVALGLSSRRGAREHCANAVADRVTTLLSENLSP
jgi:hypothetical protein